jgi:hypothetical protein
MEDRGVSAWTRRPGEHGVRRSGNQIRPRRQAEHPVLTAIVGAAFGDACRDRSADKVSHVEGLHQGALYRLAMLVNDRARDRTPSRELDVETAHRFVGSKRDRGALRRPALLAVARGDVARLGRVERILTRRETTELESSVVACVRHASGPRRFPARSARRDERQLSRCGFQGWRRLARR